MFVVKIQRFGDSLGFVLPDEVVARLRLEDGSPLLLVEEATAGFRLTPYDPKDDERIAMGADLVRRFKKAMRGRQADRSDMDRDTNGDVAS